MTFEHLLNLQRVGQLDAVPFSAELLQKMMNVAQSRLQDAMRVDNSLETRFDCAYTAIRAVADAALLKQGYRTSTSKPGHHQTLCNAWFILWVWSRQLCACWIVCANKEI